MRHIAKIIVLALAVASHALATAASDEPSLTRFARTGVVVIAHGDTTFPFSYLDAAGQARGYTVDICRQLVDELARQIKRPLELRYTVARGPRRMEVIAAGEADLECGTTTNTPERRRSVAFTYSHFISGTRLLVRSDEPTGSLLQMNGKRVVTVRGSTADLQLRYLIREHKVSVEPLEAASSAQALAMVLSGKSDGFLNDDVVLYTLRARSPHPEATKVLDKVYSVEPMGVMLRRDDPALLRAVNQAMRKLIASGELSRLYEQWFGTLVPGELRPVGLPMNAMTRDYLRRPVDLSL